jgi:hypothetical protein
LLHPLSTPSLFGPNILLSTLFLNTFSLYSSLTVRDHVSHPYHWTTYISIITAIKLEIRLLQWHIVGKMCPPPLTWEQKQIQFLSHWVLQFSENTWQRSKSKNPVMPSVTHHCHSVR